MFIFIIKIYKTLDFINRKTLFLVSFSVLQKIILVVTVVHLHVVKYMRKKIKCCQMCAEENRMLYIYVIETHLCNDLYIFSK